ncbi:RNA polymerase sigma factor RpoH [Bradyrhizobium sp. WSM 1738]|uniref:RNA polymerase sigma factor RpoH n=1 Tax=Bradyrhizobium hereditatis TaxID=2821405 RepID=UPI001CE275A8|nr:RNA polymerase sigma factor RpoH [Bradyrhizobium hereditatis]MCA6117073.1 RNA polymerase sigma factor RpoH [Bradyrhizobium hereditatis]
MSTLSVLSNLPALHSEGGLSRYLTVVREFPLLSADDEAMYARRWHEHGDREAAYRLVTSHLRLAAKLALRYRGYGLPIADLISEANLGLMHAVKRFNPEKGVRLSTYAMWWIKATIHEYILRSWSLVKIGTTAAQKKLFFNLRKLKSRISAGEDSDLSPEQAKYIAAELNVDSREVVEMNGRMRGDISLNLPTTREDGSEEMQNWLLDPAPDPETLLSEAQDRNQVRTALKEALTSLTPRERHIVRARFLAEQPTTLEDLGATFGVSRERVRQIEVRALQKIRGALRTRLGGTLSNYGRLDLPRTSGAIASA